MNKKIVALVLVCVLIFSTVVAGTLAFLVDSTQKVTNTFTFGMVDIDLTETGVDGEGNKTFKIIPGETMAKDPQITVTENSEDSYVFVKVEKSANLGTYITYDMAAGWTALDGVDGVYYREYAGDDAATYNVLAGEGDAELKNGKVTCLAGVTPAQVEAAKTNAPTLAFTAYAIQKDATLTTPKAAWDAMDAQLNPAP